MATKKAATTRRRVDPVTRVTEALAPFGFPRGPGPGLGWSREDDALFERGYPHLRILTDEPVPSAASVAEKALDAIDPVLRIRVPRALATPYLRGYRVGPLLFVDSNHPPENAERRAQRQAAIRSDAPITTQLLEETLRERVIGMGDTYGRWRTAEVLHLYEHFIGSEAVARAVTEHLMRAATDLSTWGFAGEDPGRLNAAPHHLALALPWVLRRVPAAVATELRDRLATARPIKKGAVSPESYFALLHAIARPDEPRAPSLHSLGIPLAFAHDRAEPLTEALAKQPRHLLSTPGRWVWLLGSRILAEPLTIGGVMLPPLVDSLAPLKDPGVVRLVARIGSQRAGAKAAGEWLSAHRDYTRPVLEALAALDDPKESAAASKALALLAGAPAPTPPATEEDLEREITAIFARLGDALRRSADRDAEARHIREAYEAYTEARAAMGDPTPEAYFTHRFGDFGLGQWAMTAVDVID